MIRKKIELAWGLLRFLKEIIWNCGHLRIHGIRYYIGKNARLTYSGKGIMDLGEKTWISTNSEICSSGGKITIGNNNFFNSNVQVVAKQSITIGDNNLFGPNVVIVDHNHKYDDVNQLICRQGFTTAPIQIGSDIWIGANVLVCPGVTICNRVIIAGNAVVNRPITQSGIYGGVPARLIKPL